MHAQRRLVVDVCAVHPTLGEYYGYDQSDWHADPTTTAAAEGDEASRHAAPAAHNTEAAKADDAATPAAHDANSATPAAHDARLATPAAKHVDTKDSADPVSADRRQNEGGVGSGGVSEAPRDERQTSVAVTAPATSATAPADQSHGSTALEKPEELARDGDKPAQVRSE